MKKSKKRYNKTKAVVSIIGFLICTALLLYPLVSDRWNKYRDKQIIDRYIDEVNNGNPSFYEGEIEKAHEYNEKLALLKKHMVTSLSLEKNEEYETILNATGTGIMCYIEIPKIGLTEPVYHYSSDESLEKGIGHIHGSSLPVGEKNTFCILTGHRGLPSQKLFTDLDRMQNGDMFYIHVLGHTLAYRVCDIKVILPHDVSDLILEKDRDMVVLVTCDPYGVNTHRLLVFGERTEFDEANVENGHVTTEEQKTVIDPAFIILAGFIVFIVIMFVTEITRTVSEKKNTVYQSKEQNDDEITDEEIEDRKEKHTDRKAPGSVLFMSAKERLSHAFESKPHRRRVPIKYEYIDDYYDDYDYEYEVVRIYRRPRKASRKHSKKNYIFIGVLLGLGIAGLIVLVYRYIKKRREQGSNTREQ